MTMAYEQTISRSKRIDSESVHPAITLNLAFVSISAMALKSLKTKMCLVVATIMLLSMGLIDFAMIIVSQRDMIQSEIHKSEILISVIEELVTRPAGKLQKNINETIDPAVYPVIDKSKIISCLVLWPKKTLWLLGSGDKELDLMVSKAASQVSRSGKEKNLFWGSAWGVLWKQKRNVIVSRPVWDENADAGAIAIVMSLENIYERLRSRHSLFLIYIFANTVVLTLFALRRFTVLVTRPLNKLLKRADEYREDSDVFFLAEKEDNEFTKLSRSLHSMLKRIADDRNKLKKSVESLEKANLELKNAQKEIIRAEKLASVGRLSSGLAHEIGNPIGIILGYLELIKSEEFCEEEKIEFIDRAESEIIRVKKIIRQLLDLSRPSDEIKKVVSVHAVIHEIAAALKYQPLMANMSIELDLKASTDRVLSDPAQLRQVFLNLAINAADAISSIEDHLNGKLVILSRTLERAIDNGVSGTELIEVEFKDNGPGIPHEHLENIYDPFYTTKDPGKGTGLGLSVSFMIIEGAGGRIFVRSEENEGTTVTILLPVHEG